MADDVPAENKRQAIKSQASIVSASMRKKLGWNTRVFKVVAFLPCT